MQLRRALHYAIPIVVLGGTVALLANGPLYRRWSKQECLAAYAGAKTRGDSARVDLHTYRPEPPVPGRRRCGEVRPMQASNAAEVLGTTH